MEVDKNYEKLASKLTWHSWPSDESLQPHAGMLIKTETGEIYLVGDLTPGDGKANDDGCGCCSSGFTPIAYADIYELLG
jgi:hypothetical protein